MGKYCILDDNLWGLKGIKLNVEISDHYLTQSACHTGLWSPRDGQGRRWVPVFAGSTSLLIRFGWSHVYQEYRFGHNYPLLNSTV